MSFAGVAINLPISSSLKVAKSALNWRESEPDSKTSASIWTANSLLHVISCWLITVFTFSMINVFFNIVVTIEASSWTLRIKQLRICFRKLIPRLTCLDQIIECLVVQCWWKLATVALVLSRYSDIFSNRSWVILSPDFKLNRIFQNEDNVNNPEQGDKDTVIWSAPHVTDKLLNKLDESLFRTTYLRSQLLPKTKLIQQHQKHVTSNVRISSFSYILILKIRNLCTVSFFNDFLDDVSKVSVRRDISHRKYFVALRFN